VFFTQFVSIPPVFVNSVATTCYSAFVGHFFVELVLFVKCSFFFAHCAILFPPYHIYPLAGFLVVNRSRYSVEAFYRKPFLRFPSRLCCLVNLLVVCVDSDAKLGYLSIQALINGCLLRQCKPSKEVLIKIPQSIQFLTITLSATCLGQHQFPSVR